MDSPARQSRSAGSGRRFLPIVASAALLLPASTHADALVVTRAMKATTIAEIFIGREHVRAELEIGMPDLAAFSDLLPDEARALLDLEPESFELRIRRFVETGWVITADGEPLIAHLERIEPRTRITRDEITGEPLAGPDEPESVLFLSLRYALESRPATLVLSPPATRGPKGVSVGFVAYHEGLPVNDFRYLGAAETLDLDWDDPWYSSFRNRNLRRQYNAPLSVFVYVDHFEVRKEIIARPRDLQRWIDLGLAGADTIRVADQDSIKARVTAFFAERNPLTIDGVTVQPTLDRVHFLRRTLRRTGVVDPPEDLSTVSATLGIIFSHPVDGLPETVSMPWDLFGERFRQIPGTCTDEAGGLATLLTPDDPVLEWRNFLTNPSVPATVVEVPAPASGTEVPLLTVLGVLLAVGSLVRVHGRARFAVAGVLVVAATALTPFARARVPISMPGRGLSDEAAHEVLSGLLTNVYRAFDFREEDRIYDALARSASGGILAEIYLETQRALELRNQGGARVKIQDVQLESVEAGAISGRSGFTGRAIWQVKGSVGHWGHIHSRANRYVGRVTVEPIEGAWRITGLEVLEEDRTT